MSNIINRSKLDLISGSFVTCPRGRSVLGNYMEMHNIPVDAVRDVDLSFEKIGVSDTAKWLNDAHEAKNLEKALQLYRANRRLDRFLKKGWNFGGRIFTEFYASAGAYRQGGCTLIEASIKEQIEQWWTCGYADVLKSKLPLSKYNVYMARMDCTSHPWDEYYPNGGYEGRIPEINPRNGLILKDAEFGEPAEYDHVYADYVARETLSVDEKITDGFMMYIVDDLGLDADQRKELLKSFKNFTLNMPGFKAVVHLVLKSTVLQYIHVTKANTMVKDFWGTERDVKNVQFITFGSAFKWAKAFTSLEEYCEAYEKYNHHCEISVVEHKKAADVPYQMTQSLRLDEAGVDYALERELNMFADYAENPYKLIGGAAGKAAEMYPALYQTKYIASTIQTSHAAKRWQTAGGRFHKLGFYAFCCPDPVAVLQYVLGQPITGYLKKGEMRCRFFEAGKDILGARNPFLDSAFNIKKNAFISSPFMGFYATNALFHSVHDVGMRLSQMDFDGDKMFVTDNAWFIRVARNAILNIRWSDRNGNKNIAGRCLFYDAKSNPADYSAENFKKQLRWLKPAQVGLIVNAVTVEYAKPSLDYQWIALKTECANTCVDNAKNGGQDNPVVMKKLEKEAKNRREGKGDFLPLFHAYAKSSAMVQGSFDHASRGHAFMESSAIDVYSQKFLACTDTELALPETDAFDPDMLMNDSANFRRLPGLVRNGSSTQEAGLFNKLAVMSAEEYSNAQSADVNVQGEVSRSVIEIVRRQVFEFGAANGYTAEETVDNLVRGVYGSAARRNDEKSSFNVQLQRTLWTCFGVELMNNVARNTMIDIDMDEELCEVIAYDDESMDD